MLKIRLARTGHKNDPFYRIVAIEHTRKRGGKALDTLGFWHPKKNTKKIDKKKVEYWISVGATKSEAVERLITKST